MPTTVADAVDGFEVRQLAAEVPALPEEIHRVLGHVMTEVQEVFEPLGLTGVQVVQVDARCPSYQESFGLPVPFDHPASFRA